MIARATTITAVSSGCLRMQHSDFLHPPLLFGRSVKFLQTVLFFTQIFLYAFSQSTTSLQNRGVTGRMATAMGKICERGKKARPAVGVVTIFYAAMKPRRHAAGLRWQGNLFYWRCFTPPSNPCIPWFIYLEGRGRCGAATIILLDAKNFPRLTCAPQRGVWRKRERGIMHSGASG